MEIINKLKQFNLAPILQNIKRGVEKECLRIAKTGLMATTKHPRELGSKLTHPFITTDYAENLLEFVSSPSSEKYKPLDDLYQLHLATYHYIAKNNELLWPASMPCGMTTDCDIPIANYGKSNLGFSKEVYRRGLGYRYGRKMQAIAGIHYNFSYPKEFWQLLKELEGNTDSIDDYISEKYFALIRNYLRYGWIVTYLFGASPALCQTYFDKPNKVLSKRGGTLFGENATSLRLSDIGYQNKEQDELNISVNSLNEYVLSLQKALNSNSEEFSKIKVKENNNYKQLNTNKLQIEAEYYSIIRPKRISKNNERPIKSLSKYGVEYIELRSLDLNPFSPIGIEKEVCDFLDLLLIYCTLENSDTLTNTAKMSLIANHHLVAAQGRALISKLDINNKTDSIENFALNLLDKLLAIAKLIEPFTDNKTDYVKVVKNARSSVKNPKLLPSYKILNQLNNTNISFFEYTLNQANAYAKIFGEVAIDKDYLQEFAAIAEQSLAKQTAIEKADTISFEEYLATVINDTSI